MDSNKTVNTASNYRVSRMVSPLLAEPPPVDLQSLKDFCGKGYGFG
jgi:hypothetical protein